MQEFPKDVDMNLLKIQITKLKEVVDVHYMQGWSVDEKTTNITFHVTVPGSLTMFEVDTLRKNIESILKERKIAIWTIQFESQHSSPTNV